MILKELDINNKEDIAFVENLYIESFPISERRPVSLMLDIYKNNAQFVIYLATMDNNNVGFLTYWDLGKFIFAEHFAISPEFRNGGNGGKVMKSFISKIAKPIVLEVELPTTILSERRIGFYQRLGFKLWENIQYQQPPYSENNGPIPMKIMSYGELNSDNNLTDIRNTIYSKVYNC